MADVGQCGLREVVRFEELQDNVAGDELFKDREQFWIHGIGLFKSDLTVEHYNRRKVGIASVRPFEGAGMADLGAGSGFEGTVPAYGPHIEMVE
jgi:hypothetical protein